MKDVKLYEGTIAKKAKKLVRTLPKDRREEYERYMGEMLEWMRTNIQACSYDVNTEKRRASFDDKSYKIGLDTYIEKIELYVNSVAKGENQIAAIDLLLDNPRLIFTGEFGLEAKIRGFGTKTLPQIEEFFADLDKKYKITEDARQRRAEAREKSFQIIEEETELSKIPKRNPYSRPNHPSLDSR